MATDQIDLTDLQADYFGRFRGEIPSVGQGYPILSGSFSNESGKFTLELIIFYEDREVGRGSVNVG